MLYQDLSPAGTINFTVRASIGVLSEIRKRSAHYVGGSMAQRQHCADSFAQQAKQTRGRVAERELRGATAAHNLHSECEFHRSTLLMIVSVVV
jgi:hypothetical protein